jgi:hypothetical protein
MLDEDVQYEWTVKLQWCRDDARATLSTFHTEINPFLG